MKMTSQVIVRLIAPHLAGDRYVAMMAWSSTNKWEDALTYPIERIVGMIRFLLRGSGQYKAHASPFGHSHFTVYCEAPLAVLGHIVRHRSIASLSVLSLRFTVWQLLTFRPDRLRKQVGKPGAYTMVEMTGWRNWLGLRVMHLSYVLTTLAYLWLIKLGVANELARFVAPEGRMTQWFMTMSLRNGLNFLVLRDDDHTMQETRELAVLIREIMREHWPITLAEWEKMGRPQL